MAKAQSPCIGVCKYRRKGPAGTHCIACSMTKDQKSLAKKAKKPSAMEGFIALILAQQAQMGGYRHWRAAYLKKALKKGRKVPDQIRKTG